MADGTPKNDEPLVPRAEYAALKRQIAEDLAANGNGYVRQDWLPEAELVISRVLRSPTIAALLVDAMVDRELGGSRV